MKLHRNLLPVLVAGSLAQQGLAFCGFYVAKADATLFNDRSEIILVRDGQRTTITMSNDFKGDVRDFAMVVPVPTVLREQDIRVVDRSLFDQLDAYSAPRLVEYYDANPCQRWDYAVMDELDRAPMAGAAMKEVREEQSARSRGVTIEARYSIGEYDILILSAKESEGLKDWLIENGYRIPATANEVLDPYIKDHLKFFVVKVDLERMQDMGFEFLRPIQVSFESDRFMLPIRLGMANSKGEQDMIVYAFTRTGRVECANYRTVDLPTDRHIPLYVKDRFGEFYRDLFKRHYEREGRHIVTLEYAWNVTPSWNGVKCDPCVGPPPLTAQLTQAGVDWVGPNGGANGNVFFTRLHVRYARADFPQDLLFQVTPDQQQFQGRYILTHPAQGDLSCSAGQDYLEDLYYRRKKEVDELATLTGWNTWDDRRYIDEVKGRMTPERRNGLDAPVIPFRRPGGGQGPGSMLWLIGLAALVFGAAVHIAARSRALPG
ncbi:MAG: DUF2330 domain-containing protein [Flavobacteriales bacterium]|nr:DUF2330 domain-containing protein [Flavobacteriales bacterium]